MVKQGCNYIDNSIQSMGEFFEIRIENLERFDSKKNSSKTWKNKANKKREHSDQNFSKYKSSQGTESGKKCFQYQCVDALPTSTLPSRL